MSVTIFWESWSPANTPLSIRLPSRFVKAMQSVFGDTESSEWILTQEHVPMFEGMMAVSDRAEWCEFAHIKDLIEKHGSIRIWVER